MNQPFIPTWAEKELQRPTPFDTAELELLREFYDAWEALHSIKGDKRERHIRIQYEVAAENLVQRANVLRNMREARRGR